MKYTTGGPKPCDPIDSAHERIADLQATRERRRDRFEATELMTQPTSGEIRENWLSDLTRYCNTHLFQQYDERLNYAVRCVTPAEYLVKRLYAPWTGRETLVDDQSKTCDERKEIYLDWYIPKWERTRTIRVCTVNQMTVAVCDCGTYVQNGWCCRHVYSLLLRKPKKEDAAIRWWKTYIFYYGRHHQGMNANLTYLRNNSLPGILIEKKEVSHWHANQIQSRGYQFPIDAGYFDRSLGTPKLRGPSHWTSLRRGSLNPEDTIIPAGYPNVANRPSVLEHTLEFGLSQQRMSQMMEEDGEDGDGYDLFPDHNDDSESDGGQSRQSKDALKERIRILETELATRETELATLRGNTEKWNDKRKTKRNPYTEIQPLVNQITRDTRTEGCLAYLVDSLHGISKEMLRRKSELKSTRVDEGTGIASLPALDKRKNDERKKKASSPQKNGKRKYNNP